MKSKRARAGIPILVFYGAAVFFSSCTKPAAPPAKPVESARSILFERVGFLGTQEPIICRRDRICGSDVLPGFYRARNYRPAWIDDDLKLRGAAAFLSALHGVTEDGLNPQNYHLPVLEALLAEIQAAKRLRPPAVQPEALADLEMLLTDAFFLCGSHLVHGQVNAETIQSEWFIKGRVEDLAAVLEKGIAQRDIRGAFDSLKPNHPVYRGLKQAYRKYQALAKAGGWTEFPPGPKLKKGDRDERVEAIRNSLEARGDLVPWECLDPALFDDGLEDSVKAFQLRHGLEPDGALGDDTAAILNVPIFQRLKQIRANLERWRWVTQDLGERYILINVADFRVGVVDGVREVLSMPAIVGRSYRRTPDFSGKLSAVEINPAWTVPPKLAREDILPKIKKDPGYLKKMGIRVFEGWAAGAREIDPDGIDWSQVTPEGLRYKFRQDPGPLNALGRIKFIFPNKFDVYLHDTPERELFTRAVRNLSSGCIRVARPVDLAEYVLRDDPNWSRDKILAAMGSPTTRVIHLRNSLGVNLLYWTAWLADDGRVNFREDIYLRDEAVYLALEQSFSTPEK
jgi:murein L,D-transpeptidase YcbB/YkuD